MSLASGNQPSASTAIAKVDPKVGSALPTFSAPPIDQAILSNMKDSELLFMAKNACTIHAQAGAYAKDFLAEMKRRFAECKKVRKPYLGHKNFDQLCADKLEITARQVRNILNDNPGGRKGRKVKARPSLKELEEEKAKNKRLEAYVKQLEAANDRASKAPATHLANGTQANIDQVKKDAVRDLQKIMATEKREADRKIAALEHKLGKVSAECRKLQKRSQRTSSQTTNTDSRPSFAISGSPIDESEAWSKEETVRQIVGGTISIIKHLPAAEKRWIVDEAAARLRCELAFDGADAPTTSSDARHAATQLAM